MAKATYVKLGTFGMLRRQTFQQVRTYNQVRTTQVTASQQLWRVAGVGAVVGLGLVAVDGLRESYVNVTVFFRWVSCVLVIIIFWHKNSMILLIVFCVLSNAFSVCFRSAVGAYPSYVAARVTQTYGYVATGLAMTAGVATYIARSPTLFYRFASVNPYVMLFGTMAGTIGMCAWCSM